MVSRDEVPNPVGNDARLSAACTGQNEDRAVSSRYCFALLGIETGEKIH